MKLPIFNAGQVLRLGDKVKHLTDASLQMTDVSLYLTGDAKRLKVAFE